MQIKEEFKKRQLALSVEQQALLAKRLRGISTHTVLSPPTITRRQDRALAPASLAQQRLWFLQELEPENVAYNEPLVAHMTGHLNREILTRVVREIVRRHETLRTMFVNSAGQIYQHIHPYEDRNVTVSFFDAQEIPLAQREAEVQRQMKAVVQSPFRFSQQELAWRIQVIRITDDEHVFLLTMHHIICDGWSMDLFIQELATLYERFAHGKPSTLPELTIQYGDFAHWQRQWLQGDVQEQLLTYWKQQLNGAPALLELPSAHPRPAIQTYHGHRFPVSIPPTMSQALLTLSQGEGVTLFMTVLAVFNVWLQRYSGQDDLVVGSPMLGRTSVETESLIGCFVNNLVLRNDLSGNPTFRELLQRVRRVALQAYDHQEIPFEKLIEALQLPRSLNHAPVFQVLLNLQTKNEVDIQLPGITIRPLEVESGAAKYDLFMNLRETTQGITGYLEYSTDLFDEPTIKRMLSHFYNLLAAVVANASLTIGELPMLSPHELQQQVIEWNATAVEYEHGCVNQLFEQQVARTPSATAAIYQNERITYDELNRRANQLAHYLCAQGVGPGVMVGISIAHSFELLIGLLAVIKAGATYVPLDLTHPQERLTYISEDTQIAVWITQLAQFPELPPSQARIICVDAEWPTIAQEPSTNIASRAYPEDTAYILYTSGSTGKPKGVCVPHNALVNFLLAMRREPGIHAHDTMLAVTTISFDISALELFLPLIVGATVTLISREIARDGMALHAYLENNTITMMQATPTAWRILLNAGWSGTQGLRMLCGGELLSRELATQLVARGESLWNMYGPTEATVWSSVHKVELGREGPISIGKPIANVQYYVLDRFLHVVPVGIAGELYISGDGLAQGYHQRPELTERQFIPHPFCPNAEARLYKTGDLARYLSDGTIEVIGRVDDQVKIRGFRIELGEIEVVLGAHSLVQGCVVIVREDIPGDKRLVAYILSGAQEPSVSDLRTYLKSKLPEYMVPVAFVTLDAFPLTTSGKINRKMLPAPDQERPHLENTFTEPQTPTEQLLLEIWLQVLGIEQIGTHDSFFDLGGDSLSSFQMIASANEAGLNLTPKHIFQYQTIAQLAQLADEERAQ